MSGTERRIVTVLFADLVGFTTLSERLDAEDVALVQDQYFTNVAAVIGRHGGQVEKFIGDAVVATFGLPHARGDDASRAVRAATAIVDAVASAERTLSLATGTLQVRVGVNTGEVVVVRGSAADGDWRLAGDVVNTAARLQTAAEPGSVLVGAATAFGAADAFVFEPVGAVTLKGKAAPTKAWRVVRARTVPSRESALGGLHAEIVGRDDELVLLEEAHRHSAKGVQAVLLLAPPGVGKSRLVTEFRNRTLAEGGAVWAVKVSGEDGRYGAVAELMRNALGPLLSSPDSAQLLLQRLASETPRARLSVEHTLALVSGERLDSEPAELWTSWKAMLDAHPGSEPPVWVIEDVHLAAADVRAFLRDVVADGHRASRMILMTARPTALVPLGEELFGAVRIVDLEPLEPLSRVALVERLIGAGVLPDALVDMVTETSRGNPLFIEELLRSWVQTGALHRGDDGWEFDSGAGRLHVPTTVAAIYLGQLDDLPPDPRAVVESGSVPGTTFPSRALPVLGAEGGDGALDFLTTSGVLDGPHAHDVDAESYTYRHALLRDTAYACLPRSRRAELHRRFAEWLAASAGSAPVAELVGKHFALAHEEAPELGGGVRKHELAERAAEWLERAADDALASAPRHAAELFERARELTDGATDEWARRQLGVAEALRRAGRLPESLQAFAAVPVDGAHVVAAALGYEDALFASRLPRERWAADGRSLLRAALDRSHGDAANEARLLAAQSRTEIYGGAADAGAATARAALAAARESGDRGAIAQALLALRAAQDAPELLTERLASARELVAAAREAGDEELEVEGLRLLFVDLLEAGDMVAADTIQRQAEARIGGLGRPLYFWYPPMWRTMRALLAGDFRAAEALVEHFRQEGTRWHYQQVDMVHAVQLWQLHAERGHGERALAVVEQVTTTAPERFAPVLAACLAHLGRLDEARDQLAGMRIPDDQSRCYVLSLAADAAAIVGDGDLSATLRSDLERWAGHHVVLGSGAICLGSASHFAGLAARTCGDLDAAASHLRDAVRMNDTIAAAPAAARARAELARTLLALGQAEEARALTTAAAAEARRLGMAELLEQLAEI